MFKLPASSVILKKMHATTSEDVVYADIEFMRHRSFEGVDMSLKFLNEFSNYI